MNKRIGFACKWIDYPHQVNGIKPKDDAKQYNTGATTVAWLNRQSREVAEQKLWDLMVQNIAATQRLVDRVGTLDENLRMVRLSSDLLPVYTEPTWRYFWRRNDVREYCHRHFGLVGESARRTGTRLSFHPGQFCVLASDNPEIVGRSIEEFEYHADMVRWMGYGKSFQDFKVNVHIAGRRGPDGIREAYQRLSVEARNTLTIENEEITHNLDTCLKLTDIVPIVLDIHHHWINSGEYIQSTDDRVKKVIDSWRGRRPVIHYSVSREDCLVEHTRHQLPDLRTLLESGHKKGKLRAHSDFYWNDAVNDWALTHWSWADIMCESKAKNLASFKLFEHGSKHHEQRQQTEISESCVAS
jgi:UV DNA damage repair endonuclease